MTEPATDLGPRFRQAIEMALDVHDGHVRRGTGIPYAAHLLGVCALVLDDGGAEDEAVAALLHDAAEHRGGRTVLDRIRRTFGERVARIVEQCSDSIGGDEREWRERKQDYIDRLDEHLPEALRVSTADKLFNVRSIVSSYRSLGPEAWSRCASAPREDTLWYYRAAADRLGRLWPGPLADELDRAVRVLEELVGEEPADG